MATHNPSDLLAAVPGRHAQPDPKTLATVPKSPWHSSTSTRCGRGNRSPTTRPPAAR